MWTEKDPHVQYTKGRREETRRHLRATETNFNLSVDFHTQHMKDHSYIFFIWETVSTKEAKMQREETTQQASL